MRFPAAGAYYTHSARTGRAVPPAEDRRTVTSRFLPTDPASTERLRHLADESGLHRLLVLAWRDLADVEAGGSEVHAHEVLRRWASADLDVTLRTSYAQGSPPMATRDGYQIIRKAGRYLVFPRAALSATAGRMGTRDGLVEIWNGMPFLSPVWDPGPRIAIVHHVHGEMWRMVLPPNLARMGEVMESRIAPKIYRRTRIVTLSSSSKNELVDHLGFAPHRVDIVPPGIDPRFSPGTERSPHPLVVAVGRLVPVKRFDALIRAVAPLRGRHPGLELVIAGEGYERDALEELIDELGAEDWVKLPGRVDDDEIVDLFQRAWLITSASAREGWGMTLTEAAACGTPAVASRTTGHMDAVVDGKTGVLCDTDVELAEAIDDLLGDHRRRNDLADAALEWAARFTWDATAEAVLGALAEEAAQSSWRRRRR